MLAFPGLAGVEKPIYPIQLSSNRPKAYGKKQKDTFNFLWFPHVGRISSAYPNLHEMFSTYSQETFVEKNIL